jgi:hypothetical protein
MTLSKEPAVVKYVVLFPLSVDVLTSIPCSLHLAVRVRWIDRCDDRD